MLFRPKPIAALLALLSTVALPGFAGAQSLTTRELNARSAAQAAATVPPVAPGAALPIPSDPVEALSRYLRTLATSPRNLDALTGAGTAALAIGDANAAVSLFARAEEISPRNGRIKAGLASGLVQLDQPRTAIKLFDDAVALGVPEAEIAGDRGLAYDLRGDTRRAQADYAQALRWRPDDEVTRRLAVSQAIGGDRAAALLTLDGLLRRQDRAAWRVRAFVLALSGDRAGAEAAAIAVMPQAQAQALIPFFGRLAALRPGQKAAAVHLGQFPSDGRSSSVGEPVFANAAPTPQSYPAPRPSSDTPLAPAGPAFGTRPSGAVGTPVPYSVPGAASYSSQARAIPAPSAFPNPSAASAAAPRVETPAPANRPILSAPAAAGTSVPPASNPRQPAYPPAYVPLATGGAGAASSVQARVEPIGAAPQPATRAMPPFPTASAYTAPVTAPALAGPPPATPQPVSQPPQGVSPVDVAAGFASDPLAAGATQPAIVAAAVAAPRQPELAIRTVDLPAQASARATSPDDGTAPIATAERPSRPVLSSVNTARPDSQIAAEARAARQKAADEQARKAAEAKAEKAAKAKADIAAKAKDAEAAAAERKGADAKGKAAPEAAAARSGKGAKDSKDTKSTKGNSREAKADGPEKADDAPKSAAGEKYWVQVASGANRADLGKVWNKTRDKAPRLLAGRTTWTTPWKQSNRLLVGPFKSEEEAQGFVNSLGKAGLGGIPFTTRGKTKVERLGSE